MVVVNITCRRNAFTGLVLDNGYDLAGSKHIIYVGDIAFVYGLLKKTAHIIPALVANGLLLASSVPSVFKRHGTATGTDV